MVDMSHLEEMDGLTFETDRNGFIQCIGTSNWNAFAVENGAPELDAGAVIGHNLFDFIEGAEVQDQLRRVMDRIAHNPNWSWVLPFRCDAPDRERGICQNLRPSFSGQVCTGFIFQSVEQYSRQRPPIKLYDFKRLRKLAEEGGDLPVIQMCSWCQRVRTLGDGANWVSAEDYYAAGGRSEVRISHAICDECLESTADPFLTEE